MEGSASGDLYLRIRLVPHPLFDVEGHNLIIILPIAPWEAALGCKVTLPDPVWQNPVNSSCQQPEWARLANKRQGPAKQAAAGRSLRGVKSRDADCKQRVD